MLNIVVADSNDLYREAISGLLSRIYRQSEITEVTSYEKLITSTSLRFKKTDLLFIDLELPGLEGFDALAHLKRCYPELPIIVKYHSEEPVVASQTYECGASAFVSKGILPDRLSWVVRTVLDGQMPILELGLQSGEREALLSADAISEQERWIKQINQLNSRQIQVLIRLTEGKLNKQIADDLNISLSSVKAHMKVILRVLEVKTRTQAALIAKKLLTVHRKLQYTTNPILLPTTPFFEESKQRRLN
jgi:DNA-binding NarL/FixJ family response regulator